MTDNSHSGDDRFNVTEKPEALELELKRPGIKASQPKKELSKQSGRGHPPSHRQASQRALRNQPRLERQIAFADGGIGSLSSTKVFSSDISLRVTSRSAH